MYVVVELGRVWGVAVSFVGVEEIAVEEEIAFEGLIFFDWGVLCFIANLRGGIEDGWGVFPNVLLGLGGVGGRSFCAARIFLEACKMTEVAKSLDFIELPPIKRPPLDPLN